MVSHNYNQHKFPVDRYGSPTVCECGVSYDDHCKMPTPKERVSASSKRCEKYSGVRIDSFSTPRWNQGLGCYTSSVRETEKLARRKGLEPIGDAKMESVFKKEERMSSRQIAHEAIMDFRKERRTLTV